ncbi:hypothetical protein L195_g060201 [Trifolium pratense]|uniref:Uncharacterized protein n=1 Tax=Trifolium pratense TaxID=57577 RepID=A0A2K3K2F2_TRIPR|nr:hypothetical protein L195_g060201 [Trifolium pratense]
MLILESFVLHHDVVGVVVVVGHEVKLKGIGDDEDGLKGNKLMVNGNAQPLIVASVVLTAHNSKG